LNILLRTQVSIALVRNLCIGIRTETSSASATGEVASLLAMQGTAYNGTSPRYSLGWLAMGSLVGSPTCLSRNAGYRSCVRDADFDLQAAFADNSQHLNISRRCFFCQHNFKNSFSK
jgi:hypothetical protein